MERRFARHRSLLGFKMRVIAEGTRMRRQH